MNFYFIWGIKNRQITDCFMKLMLFIVKDSCAVSRQISSFAIRDIYCQDSTNLQYVSHLNKKSLIVGE